MPLSLRGENPRGTTRANRLGEDALDLFMFVAAQRVRLEL